MLGSSLVFGLPVYLILPYSLLIPEIEITEVLLMEQIISTALKEIAR